ncbi:MAG: DUF3592 domain-containing protein [Betaproteobacteria bacterium]|nr:MAG: DUF3592 domain-containing protein [Betaproteobacteria bacterium]
MRVLRALPALIFGLMFAGGGLFFLSQLALPMWQDWRAMRDWQPAYAMLRSVSGSENETKASYQYEFDGVGYSGDRIYVSSFNDNIGPYHKNLLAKLRQHQRNGESVPVWVNPQDPGQAVIDRNMRWGLFALMSAFCSVFVLIGLLVAYAGIRSAGKKPGSGRPSLSALRREWKQKNSDPQFTMSFLEYAQQRAAEFDEQEKSMAPQLDWHLRKGWGTSTIRSEAKSGLIAIWGFAVFWNAISWPLILVLPKELAKENYPALFTLAFPLVGLFLLYQALRKLHEYRRFGVVTFEMDPYPGSIGGHVGGQVRVSRLDYGTATYSTSKLLVRLECVYSYISGSGKNRSRREDVKWAEEGAPHIESSIQGIRLSFHFNVPENLPAADVEQTGAYHFWRLSIKADIPGVDLDRQFNIPVFKRAETTSSVREDISAQVAEKKEQKSEAARQSIEQGKFDLPGLSRAMRISDYGGEIRMAFPMFRNKVLSVFAAVFAGGFGFASYQMFLMVLKGGVMGVFIGLFSVPFVLVAIVASLATIYLPLNNLRVRIARNEITVLRRLLFIPVFYRRLSVTDVSHLTIKSTGSTGQGVNKVGHFKVLAHDRYGKKVTLAEDIDGEAVAGHFRDYLARRLNVEVRK